MQALGRSPHGERGLKYTVNDGLAQKLTSLSSWRAWIEMRCGLDETAEILSRSPHGERGLKYRNKGYILSRS